MTPTITILGERLHRIIQSGDVKRTAAFESRDLEYLIRDEAAAQIKREWFETRNAGAKDVSGQYIRTVTATVENNEDRDENFVTIPFANWIHLPGDCGDEGIQSVRPHLETTNTKKSKEVEQLAFIPIAPRYRDLIATLPSQAMEGHHCFEVRGTKIYFTKRYDRSVIQNGIVDVDMDVITLDPTVVGVNDALPISEDMVRNVIVGILQLFGMSPEQAKEAAKKNA